MNDKKDELENVSSVNDTKKDQDLISSEDVLAVVNGDQVALVEQMERAKEAALANGNVREEEAAEKAKKKLEEKAKKEAAIMAEVKRRKEEAERKERLAKEEAERKRREAEAERQRQLAEQARQAELARQKAEQERLEAERKQQEIEAAKKKKEEEKQAKIQARIDAKNAKIAAKEAAKKAKEEAHQAKIAEKEARTKAKEEARKAKIQARLDAKKAKEDARQAKIAEKEARTKAKEEARKQKKEKGKKKEEVKAPSQPVSPTPSTNTVVQSTPTFKPAEVKPTPVPSTKPTTSIPMPKNKIVNEKDVPNHSQGNQPPKKESNFKYYLTAILFIFLILMVIFLPEISSFISNAIDQKEQEKLPEVTSGTLYCKLDTNDDNLDYSYEAAFKFKNKQMYQLTFTTVTKGDAQLDALQLSEMKSSCDLLDQQTLKLEGIFVSCSLSNGVLENKQVINYDAIDVDSVTTAYLEAGGTYPNYRYLQNIDDIEQEMNSSNYTCERSK